MRIAANPARVLEGKLANVEQRARDQRGNMGTSLDATIYRGEVIRLPRKMQKGSGAPSICWQCGSQLQRAPGKGLGLFYFNLVRDKADVTHRVHGDCTRQAIIDGNKLEPAK